MKEADIALSPISQADSRIKNRPILLLRQLPPYQDFLVCGISTQLHQEVSGFDDVISPDDLDFKASGLRAKSLIRLGFLAVIPQRQIMGTIGAISTERHQRLLSILSEYLVRDR